MYNKIIQRKRTKVNGKATSTTVNEKRQRMGKKVKFMGHEMGKEQQQQQQQPRRKKYYVENGKYVRSRMKEIN